MRTVGLIKKNTPAKADGKPKNTPAKGEATGKR